MKAARVLLFVAVTVLAISFSGADAQTISWSHKAVAKFERPVEIPGRMLPPGTYILKLVVPESHVGQILSADETEVFGMFFTMTTDRRGPAPLRTDLMLEPRQKGALKWDRLIGWFSADEPVGDLVSYDRYKPADPSGH